MSRLISAPFTAYWEVTSSCTLRCRHCCNEPAPGNRQLTSAEALDLADQLGRARIAGITISGGEPLMRPDLFLILERLRSYPMRVILDTNATLLTPAIADRLSATRLVHEVRIGLEGNESTHTAQRGRGSYRKALKGIRMMNDRGIPVLAACTVTALNRTTLAAAARAARTCGAAGIRFGRLFFSGTGRDNAADLALTPAQTRAVHRTVAALARRYPPGFVTGFYAAPPGSSHRCGAALDHCVITSDGQVAPCEVLSMVHAGNIRKNSLLDIWHNSPVLNCFREHRQRKKTPPGRCRSCASRNGCTIRIECAELYDTPPLKIPA